MKNRRPVHERQFASQAQVLVAALGGAVLCASVLVSGALHWERAPFPYVWRDVAVVHFLASLPLAGAVAVFVRNRLSLAGCIGIAGLSLVISAALVLNARPERVTTGLSHAADGLVLRALPALGLAFSAALVWAALWRGPSAGPERTRSSQQAVAALLGLAILLLTPAVYVAARARHDTARLQELLEQSRLGEAHVLAGGLLALGPRAEFQGHPLRDVAAAIEQTARELESRVAAPFPAHASSDQRFERARDLAILGRTDEALGILESFHGSRSHGFIKPTERLPWAFSPGGSAPAYVCSLSGAIYEARADWEAGREWYTRALEAWRASAASPEREGRLIQATKGIAFCERKLGRYPEAEAAYQQLLARSPTADTHFLLAQFYEDTQQTAKAHTHARQAMALAPERYQEGGQQLIEKLVTLHFGCWGSP